VRVAGAVLAPDMHQNVVRVRAAEVVALRALHLHLGHGVVSCAVDGVPELGGQEEPSRTPDGLREQRLGSFRHLDQQLGVVKQLLHVIAGQTRVVETGDELRHLSPREVGDTGVGVTELVEPGHNDWAPLEVYRWLAGAAGL